MASFKVTFLHIDQLGNALASKVSTVDDLLWLLGKVIQAQGAFWARFGLESPHLGFNNILVLCTLTNFPFALYG